MFCAMTTKDGDVTITFTDSEGEPHTVTKGHVHFHSLHAAALANMNGENLDEQAILSLIVEPADAIGDKLAMVSTHFTHENGEIFYDGELVDGVMSKQIIEVVKASDTTSAEGMKNLTAVARFCERLMANPSRQSRDHLLNWLRDKPSLTINLDGTFVGYRGVKKTKDGGFQSIHSGKANVCRVNGELVPAGPVPNPIGATISMGRNNINEDVNVGCSQGLHVGTYEYASQFGGKGEDAALLMVAVDPANVVTVPKDCNFQKIRVCEFTVMNATQGEYKGVIYSGKDYDNSAQDL